MAKHYSRSQIRRMLKTPGQRAKLSDRYLPAEMLARRRANAAKKTKAPADPFLAEAEAATRTEFDPQEEDISKAEKSSDQSRSNLDAWFQQYLDQQKDVQARSAGAYTGAQGQLQAMDAKLAGQDTQEAKGLAVGGQVLGKGLGLQGDLLGSGTAQKASLARQALNDSFAARLASESVTQGNFLRDRESIVGRQRVDELGKEQSRRNELGTQRSKLGQKRRDYLSKYLAESKAAAQKQALEAQVIGDKSAYNAASLKLKQAEDAQRATDAAASRGVTMRGQDISSADRAAARSTPKGKGKKPPRTGLGSLTGGAESKLVSQLDAATDAIKTLQSKAPKKGGQSTFRYPEARTLLQTGSYDGQRYDPTLVTAAMFLSRGEAIPPNVAKKLQRMGVHLGGRYKTVKRTRKDLRGK